MRVENVNIIHIRGVWSSQMGELTGIKFIEIESGKTCTYQPSKRLRLLNVVSWIENGDINLLRGVWQIEFVN